MWRMNHKHFQSIGSKAPMYLSHVKKFVFNYKRHCSSFGKLVDCLLNEQTEKQTQNNMKSHNEFPYSQLPPRNGICFININRTILWNTIDTWFWFVGLCVCVCVAYRVLQRNAGGQIHPHAEMLFAWSSNAYAPFYRFLSISFDGTKIRSSIQ